MLRVTLTVAAAALLVLAPLVLARSSARAAASHVAAPRGDDSSQLLAARVRTSSPHVRTVVGPVRPATAHPRRMPDTVLPVVHHVTVRAVTRTTTTVRVSRPPVTTSHTRVGDATWYNWRPGQCAVHYLPKGTRIWVKDLATGKVITCVVTDFEQDGSRAVDLDTQQFAELAPLAQGVIRVEVTW